MPTLNWIGKDKVVNHHHDVPFRLLEREYSFKANENTRGNTTNNKIIYGDNLESLKSLLPEFEGKINCIYIDPPYNTGNQTWIYNDSVNDPKINEWFGKTVGKEGEDLCRHDKWLCMMFPRLKLLHRLLADEGVIFISIGNHEIHHLRMLVDEIFGYGNFIQNFIWETHGHTENQEEISEVHEYVLCYSKKARHTPTTNFVVDENVEEDSKILRDFAENSITKNGDKNPHSVIELPVGFPCECKEVSFEADSYALDLLSAANNLGYISKELTKAYEASYPVKLDAAIILDGKLSNSCRVYSGWANAAKLKKFIQNQCQPFDDKGTMMRFFLSKNGVIYYRREGRSQKHIRSVLRNYGTVEKARNELLNIGMDFPYPKPKELLQWLLSIYCTNDALILDSFAGSGSTAHAVLNLNAKDNGNRRFILCEMMEYAKSITSERVRFVMNGYKEGNKYIQGTGGGFDFYKVGAPLFKADDNLNEDIGLNVIRDYVAYTENIPIQLRFDTNNTISSHALGSTSTALYIFYYEKERVTTLDIDFLGSMKIKDLPSRPEQFVIYADKCALDRDFLYNHNITFKRIPRDITRF